MWAKIGGLETSERGWEATGSDVESDSEAGIPLVKGSERDSCSGKCVIIGRDAGRRNDILGQVYVDLLYLSIYTISMIS